MYDCEIHSLESNETEGSKTQMISKEQFLTIKRLKQEGVPIAAIARRIGISEPTTRKWANRSEAGFDELKKDDIGCLWWMRISAISCWYFYDFLSKFPRNQNMYPVSYIFPYPLFLHRITSVERQKKQVHGPIFGHAPASFG